MLHRRGDNYSFRHRRQKKMVKILREKSPMGRSPSGNPAQQLCREYIKGNCTRPSHDDWHPSECQNYKKRIGMQIP